MPLLPDRYTGTYFQTLDEKGRVPIPAKLFSALRSHIRHEHRLLESEAPDPNPMTVVVSISINGLVGIYTESAYDRLLEEIRRGTVAKVHGLDADSLIEDLENAKDTQLLDKLNRIRVPPVLKEALGINREVAVLGSGDFIELNAKEQHIAAVSERLKQLQRRRQGQLSQGNEHGRGEGHASG